MEDGVIAEDFATQWAKSVGVPCSRCKEPSLRLLDGLCISCYTQNAVKAQETLEKKATKGYYSRMLREGRITLTEMREGQLASSLRRRSPRR